MMLRFLKGVVGGSGTGVKDLPYIIGEPHPSAWGSWTHHRGTSKDDGSPVSIFSLSGSNAQDGHLAAGRNGVKRLRTVRHPNILSFLHSTEVETVDGSTSKVTIYIVTEPVMPLFEKIKELGLEGTQRDEYYAWGLNQIAKAVSFLNNDCKLVHGNVCMASVVVTPTLDWKLHAFDVLSEFDENSEAATGPMLVIQNSQSQATIASPQNRKTRKRAAADVYVEASGDVINTGLTTACKIYGSKSLLPKPKRLLRLTKTSSVQEPLPSAVEVESPDPLPARRKERSIASLVDITPKVSAKPFFTGRRLKKRRNGYNSV